MRTTLRYGESQIKLEVPNKNLAWTIDRNPCPSLEDPSQSLKEALETPIDGPPLKKLAEKASTALILINDITRQTPQHIIIPVILDELNNTGMPDSKIELMIALGTHRKMTESEIEKKLGRTILERVHVDNFDSNSEGDLETIGKMPNGTEIMVSRKVVCSDLVIGTGTIVPHCYAGWAGGGKIIQPGTCGTTTIEATHIAAGMTQPIFNIPGNIENPIRKMIDEIALKAGLKFITNVILNQNDQVSHIVTGHPTEAFRQGVELAKQIYCPEIPRRADIVIVSSYPADLDYWQAAKPADYACVAIKQRGTIILVTPCPEGISTVHPEVRTHGHLTYTQVLEAHRKGEIKDKVAAAALMLHSQIKEHANIICISKGLTKEDKEALGFTHAQTLKEALEQALSQQGKRAKIGVMKCGDIVPRLSKQTEALNPIGFEAS